MEMRESQASHTSIAAEQPAGMTLRIPIRGLQKGRWVSVENGSGGELWTVSAVTHCPEGELVEITITRARTIPPVEEFLPPK